MFLIQHRGGGYAKPPFLPKITPYGSGLCIDYYILCGFIATDSYSPGEMTSSRGGGSAARTQSARRTEPMTSSADRSNTLPRTGSHVPTSPLPVHRQSSASNTPPSVSPRQSPTWRRKTFASEREVSNNNTINLFTAEPVKTLHFAILEICCSLQQ